MADGSRILLVEDDPALAREIVRAVERDHWPIDQLASVACTAGTLLLSTPVLAAGAPVAMIKVSDLDVQTPKGSAELSRRITQAARQICRSTELDLRLESRALCYSSVRAEALDKVKLNQPR